jgi:alpha-ribazole phosphatase
MLYLVRHGETSMNKRNLMCGRTDAELTEKGKAAASDTGKKLKDIGFSAAFCSPMKRAKQTLELILSENCRPSPEKFEDSRITERDFGYFEAQTDKTHPEFHLRWRLDYDSGRVYMESIARMKERIGSFLADVRRKYASENVLVVTHNGAIRIFRLLLGEGADQDDIIRLGIDNADILAYPL